MYHLHDQASSDLMAKKKKKKQVQMFIEDQTGNESTAGSREVEEQ